MDRSGTQAALSRDGWGPGGTRFLVRWGAISLVLHLTAAGFAAGFHHPDEHWQTLEFTNCLLARSPCADLPWEYAAKMRAWAQPAFYGVLARTWIALGVEDPVCWATGFRLASSLIGWGALVGLSLCLPRWIERIWLRRWAVIALAILWCLPYLHARTSSENLGGSFLALGIALLTLVPRRTAAAFAAGGLLGLAFELRFQMGFAVVGVGLWGLLVDRWSLAKSLAVGGGVLAAIGLGSLLDSALYGSWTFSPWNYVQQNLVEGHLYRFGRPKPWWYYLGRPAGALPPLGAVLTTLAVVACVRRPRNALVWALVAFVLAHSIIARKSLRFLFPLVPLAPVLAAMALDGLRWRGRELTRMSFRQPVLRTLLVLCVAFNLAALAVASLRPPRYPTGLYAHLPETGTPKLDLFWVRGPPFSSDLKMNYYHSRLRLLRVASFGEFEQMLVGSAHPLYLYDDGIELPENERGLRQRCALEHATYPSWLEKSGVTDWLPGRRTHALYRCAPGEKPTPIP